MVKSSEKINGDKYLETHLFMMMCVGMNRPIDVHSGINALFIFRMILIVGIYVVLIIGCGAHIKFVHEYDLLVSSINILQLIIYVMAILHVGYYEFRNDAVHCLIKRIRKAFRFFSSTGHYTMEEPTRVDRQRSVGWTMLCTVAAICWFTLAMARGEDPVPVWAPVNLKESPYYEIDIVIQFLGQLAVGTLGGCFGSFYISVLTLVRHQFDLLSCSLEHVSPFAALKMRNRIIDGSDKISCAIGPKDFTSHISSAKIKNSSQCECCTEEFKRFFRAFEKRRFENTLTPLEMIVYEEELHNTLTDCIVHHQNIVELQDEIQDFFGPVILIRFILSTLMLCFTIYSTSKFTAKEDFTPTDMTFLSLVEYYVIGVIEIFIFCYIADRLSITSIAIRDVAFEKLPWQGGGVTKKFISTLKIFHLSATKPTCLRTPFYVVSITVMIAMLRMSFSFYTLLRRLQNK